MPITKSQSINLHYRMEGKDGAPWLILSNSLGTTLDMWEPQMPALQERFRVLRYDSRGHGLSDLTAGPYSISQLGADVVSLMDEAGIDRAHFCGLSMGGMTGMWLAINQANRIDRLALCNTGALIGSPDLWNARIDKVNQEGMASIVPAILDRWFTPEFQQRSPSQVSRLRKLLLSMSPVGYAASCAAVRDMDQRKELESISAPTLVIAGAHDLATPASDGRMVAAAVTGAKYVELNAAHLSNWERCGEFTDAVVTFLQGGTSE